MATPVVAQQPKPLAQDGRLIVPHPECHTQGVRQYQDRCVLRSFQDVVHVDCAFRKHLGSLLAVKVQSPRDELVRRPEVARRVERGVDLLRREDFATLSVL